MYTRIEKIDDLVIWLDCLTTLHTKNVGVKRPSDEDIDILKSAQEVLLRVKPDFPDPTGVNAEDIKPLLINTFKQCLKCGNIYPETRKWFDYNGRGRTGLNSICKFCRNASRRKKKFHSKYSQEDQAEIGRLKTDEDIMRERYLSDMEARPEDKPGKRKRGRPKGSKTKKKYRAPYVPKPGEKW